jgi:hypothetical protein
MCHDLDWLLRLHADQVLNLSIVWASVVSHGLLFPQSPRQVFPPLSTHLHDIIPFSWKGNLCEMFLSFKNWLAHKRKVLQGSRRTLNSSVRALFVSLYTSESHCINHLYIYKNICMYVCMFRHNYLSVNGIVSFPSFTWLYKYEEEYKQGEMWHSAQKAKISEKIYVPAWPLPSNGLWRVCH